MTRYRWSPAIRTVDTIIVITRHRGQTVKTQILLLLLLLLLMMLLRRVSSDHDVRHKLARLGSNLGRDLLHLCWQHKRAGSISEQSLRKYFRHMLTRADWSRPLQLLWSLQSSWYCQVVEIIPGNIILENISACVITDLRSRVLLTLDVSCKIKESGMSLSWVTFKYFWQRQTPHYPVQTLEKLLCLTGVDKKNIYRDRKSWYQE